MLAARPVPGLPPALIVWDSGDEPHLPDGTDDIAGEIGATAAALLSGKITALRGHVGRYVEVASPPSGLRERYCLSDSRPIVDTMAEQQGTGTSEARRWLFRYVLTG